VTELEFAFGAVQQRVRDLGRSLSWYRDVLGLEPFAKEDFDPNNTFAAFAIGSSPLALWQARPGEELETKGSIGDTYVNLLTPDLEHTHRVVSERGGEPTRIYDHGRFRWFWVFDPDGNRIEFAQVLESASSA
jgi:catechol 2,3-dioxygenase-like lactoylglutathione lyase family enzyme